MAVITIEDVLIHARNFERMLADYYAKLAEHTTRDGVRLLTEYMSRHQNRIEETLNTFSREQLKRVRSTPLRYEPQAADCRCFQDIGLAADASAAQVLDEAVVFDECLVSLYRQVLQQDVEPDIRQLFESLLCVEQRDEIELKKIKAMDYF